MAKGKWQIRAMLAGAGLAVLALVTMAQVSAPPPAVSDFMRSIVLATNGADATLRLGFLTTNQTSITNGNWITNLNASTAFGSGTIPLARLSGITSNQIASVDISQVAGASSIGGFDPTKATNYNGAFTGNGAGLTNTPTAALDNAALLGWISGNFGAYSNVNRFGTSNTFWAIQHQQPLRVLFEGNGWVQGSASGAVFDSVFERLTNALGIRGFYANPYGVNNAMYGPVAILDAGFVVNQPGGPYVNNRTNGWWGETMTLYNNGAGFKYQAQSWITTPMDVFEIEWVANTNGGPFAVYTNNVLLATLSAYNASSVGRTFRWTNSTALPYWGYTVAITNTAAGTNAFVAFGFENSKSAGVVFVQQANQGTGASQQNAVATVVRAPIYQSWNPTLILNLMPLNTTNGGLVSNLADSLGNWQFYQTNLPGADLVLCSQVAIAGSNLPWSVDDPYNKSIIARTNGWGYFDGIGMCGDYTNNLARGIADGALHLTTAGYKFYGDLLWNWLGLLERHGGSSGGTVDLSSVPVQGLNFTYGLTDQSRIIITGSSSPINGTWGSNALYQSTSYGNYGAGIGFCPAYTNSAYPGAVLWFDADNTTSILPGSWIITNTISTNADHFVSGCVPSDPLWPIGPFAADIGANGWVNSDASAFDVGANSYFGTNYFSVPVAQVTNSQITFALKNAPQATLAFAGDGRALTNLNGANLAAGSVANAALDYTVNSNANWISYMSGPAEKSVSGYGTIAPGLTNLPASAIQVSPYISFTPGASGGFGNSGGSSVEFFNASRSARIRQAGALTQAQLYLGSVSTVTNFVIKAWRYNGTSFDVVGKTASLHASLTSNATNTLNFYIPNVRFGDYVGVYCAWSGAGITPFSLTNDPTSGGNDLGMLYINSGQASDTAYNWNAANTNSAHFVPLLVFETNAPVIVFCGDSLMGDNGSGMDFWAPVSPYYTMAPDVGDTLGVTYNVLAKGGCGLVSGNRPYVTNQVVAAVAMHPRAIVLESVVDFISGYQAFGTISPPWQFCLDVCRTNGITPIVMKVPPNHYGSLYSASDTLNAWLETAAVTAGGFSLDTAPYLGVNDPSQPFGNFRVPNPVLTIDGLHWNAQGHTNMANAIINSLRPPTQPVAASMLSFPNGITLSWSQGAPTNAALSGSIALSDSGAIYVRTNGAWLQLMHQ